MISSIFSKNQGAKQYDKKDLELDIKYVASVLNSNLLKVPDRISSVRKEELLALTASFFKRIKICESKHEIEESEEFNASATDDTRVFPVINVEDFFIHFQSNLISKYPADFKLEDDIGLFLFRIYKHFIEKKGKEIEEQKIIGDYFDGFYTDSFIRYKQVKLSPDIRTIEPDFNKLNKFYKTKGDKELKKLLQNYFSDFIKANIESNVVTEFKGNDIVSFASLAQDFLPTLNTEFVFEGRGAGTSKDRIDFSDCITSRFFFITEYAAIRNGEKVSNAVIFTNWSNIIGRFGLNGKKHTKFKSVINKYKRPNLIKDIYILSDFDFAKVIPPLQAAHNKIMSWENPTVGGEGNEDAEASPFDASELFDEFKNEIILEAIKNQVTDIHIKLSGNKGLVNFRLNNKHIVTSRSISKDKLNRFYRILIEKSELDNNGSFAVPQDGKLAGPDMVITDPVTQNTYNVEARINLGQGGDKMYIRLTGNSMTPNGGGGQKKIKTLKELGYMQEDIDEILRITTVSPNGLILVTGATGQGKSTLLFTLLNDLLSERPEVHMLTIEDPVEMKINLYNVEQNELKDKDQYPIFIKAFLRQDPDWIMVGETRDKETLYYLKEAALTGHLCFSTFHANDTIATLNRLVNLLATDVSQRKLAMADILTFIKGVMSQKLVPKLCEHCKVEESPKNILNLLRKKGMKDVEIAKYMSDNEKNGAVYYRTNPEGCEHCRNTGNSGRQVLVEILSFIDEEVADSIANDRKPVIKSLFQKGLIYVSKGTIDLAKLIGEV